jgi:hypothetical protein
LLGGLFLFLFPRFVLRIGYFTSLVKVSHEIPRVLRFEEGIHRVYDERDVGDRAAKETFLPSQGVRLSVGAEVGRIRLQLFGAPGHNLLNMQALIESFLLVGNFAPLYRISVSIDRRTF